MRTAATRAISQDLLVDSDSGIENEADGLAGAAATHAARF
jgi:hypothetical protein